MSRPLGFSAIRVLAAVRDGCGYGLDIIAHTGLSSGTVYPTLGRMRRSGYLESRWEDQRRADGEGRPRRRYYQLTPEGAKALAASAAQVAEAAAALGQKPEKVDG